MKTKTTGIALAILALLSTHFLAAQAKLDHSKVSFYIENQKVQMNANKVRYAKEIVEYSLNIADAFSYQIHQEYILAYAKEKEKALVKTHISLQAEDFVVFKFKKQGIRNVIGADLYIFADQLGPKSEVSISKDGQNWIAVGEVNDQKDYIEFA